MKKLIYGLVMITTMLCFIACKPEVGDENDSTPPVATSDSETPASEDPGSKDPASEDPGSKEPGSGNKEPGSEDPGSKEPGSEDPDSGNKEPQVDTTTLDGWYVGTFDCAGQKLNYDTFHIDGQKMSYYWITFSCSNGEVSIDFEEDLDCEILIDGLKFNDYVEDGNPEGNNWEMYTDTEGTWLRNLDEPEYYEPMQKVLSPDKFGNVNGTINIYTNGDNYCAIMPYYDSYVLLYHCNADYMSGLNVIKNENVYEIDDDDDDLAVTITNSGCTITYTDTGSYNYLPAGDYTLYTRTTPWPTVTAE